MKKIEVECTIPKCGKKFLSIEEFNKHYTEEHLVNWGYSGYPIIRVWK